MRGRLAFALTAGDRILCVEEVEAAIAEHPDVSEAAAAPLERDFGVLVVSREGRLAVDELRAYAEKRLPAFARPRRILAGPGAPAYARGQDRPRGGFPMAGGLLGRRLTAAAGGAGRAARAARGRATPFYLFDRDVARRNLRRLREAAGPDAELFYPWKCNRHPGLLDLAEEAGFGAEVTIEPDLVTALARSKGGRVLYQGPAKSERSLDLALAAGAWLVADSEEDAGAILARSRSLGLAPRYLLRFRPRAAETSQRGFGLAPSRALSFLRAPRREGRPLPAGLAFHLGTRLLSRRAVSLGRAGGRAPGGDAAAVRCRGRGAGRRRRVPGPGREAPATGRPGRADGPEPRKPS